MAVEGKTVTIQHLSSDQANMTGTQSDAPLPEASGGGGIGGWISSHRMLLLIVGGGAILGLIVFFYIRSQQSQAAADTTDGATTDTTTSSPSGVSGQPGSPDLSPLENLMNQLQQSSDQTNQQLAALQASESSEQAVTGTVPIKGKDCPSGMHHQGGKSGGKCVCNGKNMVNKGDHCVSKGSKGGADDTQFAIGGSDMFNDMFSVREPFRNTGHKMVYSLGGSDMSGYTAVTQSKMNIGHTRIGRF